MPQTGAIYRISYHLSPGGELILDIYGRDTEGKRIARELTGTKPHFYGPAEEEALAKTIPDVVAISPGPPDSKGRPTIRIDAKYPFKVPELRRRFRRHYEADIFFDTRCRIDHNLRWVTVPDITQMPVSMVSSPASRPAVNPRKLYLDIETSDLYGFAKPEEPTNPVLSVAFYDSYKKSYGIVYTGPEVEEEKVRAAFPAPISEALTFFPAPKEVDTVAAFGEVLKTIEPDVVAGWNGYDYDYPYLSGRALRLLEAVRSPDIAHVYESFDIDRPNYHGVQRHRGRYALADPLVIRRKRKPNQSSYALNSVAMELLGFGKVDRPEGVSELHRTDLERFVAYNIFDVHLLRLIDEKLGLIPYFLRILERTEVDGMDYLYNSRQWDGLLLREARISGPIEMVLDSKDFAPRTQREGRAAEVFPTVTGIFDWVVALDLSGEYPGVIRTYNISPETRNPPSGVEVLELPTGGRYRESPPGLIPRALGRISVDRAEAKAKAKASTPGSAERKEFEDLADALKYVNNSAAGIMGSQNWRMADVEMFEDVTGIARLQLRWNKAHLEDPKWLGEVLGASGYSGQVILGDTDSCYVRILKDGNLIDDYETMVAIAIQLRDALNASYAEFVAKNGGATTNYTSVDLEGIFGRFRTLPRAHSDDPAKKRYYGTFVWRDGFDLRGLPVDDPGRLKMSGIEVKRWNNAKVTKDTQRALLVSVLERKPKEGRIEYLDSTRVKVLEGRLDDDLPIPVKLGKELVEYRRSYSFDDASDETKGGKKKPRAPPWLRAMVNYSVRTGKALQKNSEFRWFYTLAVGEGEDRDTTMKTFAIPYSLTLEEARSRGLRFELDRPSMYEKAVSEPAMLVCPELGEQTANLEEEW
jgi:DNA polymerase elongation subunit (family B)